MARGDLFASISDPRSAIRISLLLIIILGTGVRFHQLGSDSLWADELAGTMIAQNEAWSIPASLREGGAHPPLWHFLTHFVLYLGGSEFILRFPAALMGILSIPLIYVVGQRIFGRMVGLLGAFLLTLSPFHIRYSQEARMYVAMFLFSLLSLYFLWRGLEEGEKSAWLGFAISTLLNIYNTYFAFLVLIGEAVFVLVVMGVRSRPRKAKRVGGSLRSWFRAFSSLPQVRGLALSLIIVSLLYLPWLPVARENLWIRQRVYEERAADSKLNFSPSLVLGLLRDFSPNPEEPAYRLWAGALVVGVSLLAFRRQWRELLLVFLWIAPPFIAIIATGGVRKFPSRYVIYILPVYLLMISLSLEGLANLGGTIGAKVGYKNLVRGMVLVILILIIGKGSISPLKSYYVWTKQNWRDIAAFLTQRARPDEVIAVRHWLAEGLLYYSPELTNVRSVERSLSALKIMIAPYDGAWVLLPSGKTADPKGEVRRWLADNQFILLVGGRSGGGLSLYYGRKKNPMTIEETISLLGEATGFFPEPRLHCDLGQAYEAVEELGKAKIEYQKGLELDPANPCCLRGLKRLMAVEG